MSPWTVLAWILLAVVYAAMVFCFWLAGKFLGWPDWLVPAIGTGLVALALLFALIKKWLAAPEAVSPVTSGMQTLTPAMAALMPPREIAKRWDDFLPLLGREKLPVFLALGEEDALRNRLWLSTPECRYIRDDASGLAFVVYPESLWVDVPAAFVAPPAAAQDMPAASSGAPGLWEELVRFLPRLPGELRGVLAFADSTQTADAAAGASRWLAGKLAALYRKFRKAPPIFWIAASRMEDFPGGKRLVEKIAASGDGGRARLADAFGAAPAPPNTRVNAHVFSSCLDDLGNRLNAFIHACDSAAQDDALSPETHLLRSILPDMGRNAGMVCDALAKSGGTKKAVLGGVFLCGSGATGSGLAFGAALPRNAIPDRARRIAGAKPNTTLYALVWALILMLAVGLAGLYCRARAGIDAIPFSLLDPSPNPGGFGGPPPVSRYARAREELDGMEQSYRLARRVYHAPNRGLAMAETLFADNLKSWLPASDDPAHVDAWLDGLAEWVEGQRGVKPLAFSLLSGRELARIRGAHGKAGRMTEAKLLAEWRGLLDGAAQKRIDLLQNQYDRRLYADWRQNGCDIVATTLAAAEADDFAVASDHIASDPGFAFSVKAGEELDFTSAVATEWAQAAVMASKVNQASLLLDMDGFSIARIRETAKAVENVWRAVEPVEAFDKGAIAAHRLKDYKASLAAVYPRCLDTAGLAGLAADAYAPPGGSPPPPSLTDVERSWNAFANSLRVAEPVFFSEEGKEMLALLKSRFTLSFRAATVQAADLVQSEWEEMVLAPLASISGDDAIIFMLDKKPLDAFVKASAAPFLAIRDDRLVAAAALGQEFPFRGIALEWLNQTNAALAGLDKEYPVRLTLLPVTAGAAAKIFPRGITFTLAAGKEPVIVTGYNNKVETSFVWSVRTCLDVVLTILFDTFVVEKKYPGAMGLVHFLQGLDKGKAIFPSSLFPERCKELEQCGIESLTVNFEVSDPMRAVELQADGCAPPKKLFARPLYTR